jgi:heme-degrading monooxygenase HmoA
VIARIWRGAVRAADAASYRSYLEETGLREYRRTPGNRGAWLLQRVENDRCEIVTISLWDSLDSVRGFAGDDPERAVFYPEDDRFLLDRDTRVSHYDVFEY